MLSSGPEGGARLGVRMLDNSRVREGFTNRAHVDNLKSALENPEVVWKDMTKELERGLRMVCLGRSVPEDWRRQGVWVSPFGTIPKPRVVPAKHRVIKHLSHGGMYSINERIPDGEGKVPYFGHAVIAKAIIDAGPDCAMTLSDALAAFRHLEVWASDLRLLMMKLEELFYADTRVGFGSKTGREQGKKAMAHFKHAARSGGLAARGAHVRARLGGGACHAFLRQHGCRQCVAEATCATPDDRGPDSSDDALVLCA